MPTTPHTDIAETTIPRPAGPSALGTTSVQSKVIVQVTSWPPARAVTFRPRRRPASPAATSAEAPSIQPSLTSSARWSLLEEREAAVEDVIELSFRARAYRTGWVPEDDCLGRNITRYDGAGADHRAAPDRDTGHHDRPDADPDVILDHNRTRLLARAAAVDTTGCGQDEGLGGDADVVPDHEAFANVERAAAIDPGIGANAD